MVSPTTSTSPNASTPVNGLVGPDPEADQGVQLRVLGAVELVDPDAATLAATEGAVLGVLALHANQVVPTETLCGVIWPGAPLDRARGRLRTQAWHLRAGGVLARLGVSLRGTRRGWILAGPLSCDAIEFRHAAHDALEATARPRDDRHTLLQRALARWGGPPLPALDARQLLDEVRVLEHLHDRVVLDLAALQLTRSGPITVIDELLGLTGDRDGRSWHLLAAAQQREGRPADALRTIAEARRSLQTSGAPVPPELAAVEHAVLSGERVARLPTQVALPTGDPSRTPSPPPRPPLRLVEADHLRSAWADLAPATVTVEVIRGPAGAGATTLLDGLADLVRHDGGIVATVDSRSPTGWAHRPTPPTPAASPEPAALEHLLLQCGGRLLIMLDREITDGETAHRLRQVIGAAGHTSVLVVRTMSSPVVSTPPALHRFRQLVGADLVQQTHLGTIDRSSMLELLDAIDDPDPDPDPDRAWIADHAGGNPGLAVALHAAGAGPFTPIPTEAIELIRRRLGAVPATMLTRLTQATRHDGDISLPALLASTPDTSLVLRSLDALRADDLITDDDGPRFVSPLVPEVIELTAAG